MSLQVLAKRCALSGPSSRSIHLRFRLGRPKAKALAYCCLKRAESKECPRCARNCTKALIRHCRRITTQSGLWLWTRAADQHGQRVSAQRRWSRHQVGSCENRASNNLEEGGNGFLAGHKTDLTGIQVVCTREYILVQPIYAVDVVPIQSRPNLRHVVLYLLI